MFAFSRIGVRRLTTVASCAVSTSLLLDYTSPSCEAGPANEGGVWPSKDNPSVHLVHFKNTAQKNPLASWQEHGSDSTKLRVDEQGQRWANPTQNYVWTDEELDEVLSSQPKYIPETFWDHTTYRLVRFSYWFFNLMSGYSYDDPSPAAIELRVILLESIAGIPGMVAAQHRHFRSLRTLERDYGWIHTLLEEAENERMHLLTFLQLFEPSWMIRATVSVMQVVIAVPYITLYVLQPKAAHRFVGYLEETAVHTYCDIIKKMQTPGTKLAVWNELKPPQIAVDYWMMKDDATMLDMIRVIAADETHHRDVNHTFACMEGDDPNPFVAQHLQSAERAWRLREGHEVGTHDGQQSWS